jgi:hypothetical protein
VPSSKNYVVIALALTTLGGAGLAWTQYRELVELRAAAMNADERGEWQKRAGDLEKLNRQLQDELAALRAGQATDGDDVVVAADDRPAREGRGRGGFRGGPGGQGRGAQAQLNALRDKPEFQALLRVQQKAAIDARYGALFQNLNLPADQLDKLKTLLADRQTTMQDVMAAAREQGIDPRTDPAGYRKLITDAQNEINNGIKSLIGDGGLTQLQNFEQTQPQRNVVNELQQRLAYTSSPLTTSQADQLVQVLASNTPQRANGQANPGGQGRGFGGGGEFGGMLAGAFGGPGGFNAAADFRAAGPTAPVTQAAVSQAQNILSQPQLAALQDIQQQQQSQQQLQQLLRTTVGRGGAGQAPATGGGAGGGRRGKG